jgi:serine/threonine-protein kinase
VLDFGLAKAFNPGLATPSAPLVSNSPTLASPTVTIGGVILGTADYMAPEQARGKPVDKRADIWAFGVLLYEMITGRRPFHGETLSDTIASVLTGDPDLFGATSRHAARRPHADRTMPQRDPKLRLRDVGEARIVLSAPRAPFGNLRRGRPPVVSGGARRRVASAALVAIAILFAAARPLWVRAPSTDRPI